MNKLKFIFLLTIFGFFSSAFTMQPEGIASLTDSSNQSSLEDSVIIDEQVDPSTGKPLNDSEPEQKEEQKIIGDTQQDESWFSWASRKITDLANTKSAKVLENAARTAVGQQVVAPGHSNGVKNLNQPMKEEDDNLHRSSSLENLSHRNNVAQFRTYINRKDKNDVVYVHGEKVVDEKGDIISVIRNISEFERFWKHVDTKTEQPVNNIQRSFSAGDVEEKSAEVSPELRRDKGKEKESDEDANSDLSSNKTVIIHYDDNQSSSYVHEDSESESESEIELQRKTKGPKSDKVDISSTNTVIIHNGYQGSIDNTSASNEQQDNGAGVWTPEQKRQQAIQDLQSTKSTNESGAEFGFGTGSLNLASNTLDKLRQENNSDLGSTNTDVNHSDENQSSSGSMGDGSNNDLPNNPPADEESESTTVRNFAEAARSFAARTANTVNNNKAAQVAVGVGLTGVLAACAYKLWNWWNTPNSQIASTQKSEFDDLDEIILKDLSENNGLDYLKSKEKESDEEEDLDEEFDKLATVNQSQFEYYSDPKNNPKFEEFKSKLFSECIKALIEFQSNSDNDRERKILEIVQSKVITGSILDDLETSADLSEEVKQLIVVAIHKWKELTDKFND